MNNLGAIFYPKGTTHNMISFDSLYIPYIYKEIYFDKVYSDVINGKKDMTILDIGANIGITVQYFQPYAKRLIAVEPSPENFEALKANKEYNKWNNVELENSAIADKDGEMLLNFNMQNHTSHSLTYKYGGEGTNVKTLSFDTLLTKYNIDSVDFCKFDVEGAENMILKSEGFRKVQNKIQAIEIEFHDSSWKELTDYLISFGFYAKKLNSQFLIILFQRTI